MKFLFPLALCFVTAHAVNAQKDSSGDDSLLLHLRFEEAVAKDSASGRKGIATIGAIPGAGEYEGSFYFDGSDDHVRVPDFAYGPHFTVSFWFNSSENRGALYQYMFSHGNVHVRPSVNAYFVEEGHPSKNHAGRIKTTLIDSNDRETSPTYFTQAGLSDGKWHLYTVTTNEDGMTVYVDGERVDTWRHGGDPINPRGDIIIGRRSDMDLKRSYEGYLDEIRLYDRTLSAEEVRALFEAGR